jgi:hypothetical protein
VHTKFDIYVLTTNITQKTKDLATLTHYKLGLNSGTSGGSLQNKNKNIYLCIVHIKIHTDVTTPGAE